MTTMTNATKPDVAGTTSMARASSRAWVATRKGLFELQCRNGIWAIARSSFLGEPVTMLLPPDAADPQGRMLAALNLGHFGVHLHRSEEIGRAHV